MECMFIYIYAYTQIHIFVRLIWNILVMSLGVQEVSLQVHNAGVDLSHFLPVNKNQNMVW